MSIKELPSINCCDHPVVNITITTQHHSHHPTMRTDHNSQKHGMPTIQIRSSTHCHEAFNLNPPILVQTTIPLLNHLSLSTIVSCGPGCSGPCQLWPPLQQPSKVDCPICELYLSTALALLLWQRPSKGRQARDCSIDLDLELELPLPHKEDQQVLLDCCSTELARLRKCSAPPQQ